MLGKRIERFLNTHAVPPGAALLAGFSGGPDSTCLVSILHRLSSSRRFNLACAYLDHGLRPAEERAAEKKLVENFCGRRGIPLFVRALPDGALEAEAGREGVSLEAAARRARLGFFSALRREHGFDRLLLAHTLDDQIETVLWRLFQGSGAAGIRGMRACRGWILRPLLGVSRREILDYLRAEGLAYSVDSTNVEDRFLRNRIRNELVPVIRSIFPGLGRSLRSLSEKMADIDDYLKKRASEAFAWEKTGRGVKTDADVFFAAAPALRLYALYEQAGRIRKNASGTGKGTLPYRFIAPLVSRGAGDRGKIDLRGCGLVIRRDRRGLFLEGDIVADGKKGYFIPIFAAKPFALFDHWYVLRMPGEGRKLTEEPVCSFAADQATPPFVVRSRKAGDRIDLGFGHKRLKKLFHDWRTDRADRDSIPVLEDGKGILAVLGALRGFRNAVRHGAVAGCGPGVNDRDAVGLYEIKVHAQIP